MKIISPVFKHNEEIPIRYTCNGQNINPPLEFHSIPPTTVSLVLIIQDIDAEPKPWVHWLVYNIPTHIHQVSEGSIPDGSVGGICNGGTVGYEGPCPKYFKGVHHYVFQLFAVSKKIDTTTILDKRKVLEEIESSVIDKSELIGIAQGEQI